MATKRYISDWLASLPRTREFSLNEAQQMLIKANPKYAHSLRGCARALRSDGRFVRCDGSGGCVMFRYRGPRP